MCEICKIRPVRLETGGVGVSGGEVRKLEQSRKGRESKQEQWQIQDFPEGDGGERQLLCLG